jgi:hypothetical protein
MNEGAIGNGAIGVKDGIVTIDCAAVRGGSLVANKYLIVENDDSIVAKVSLKADAENIKRHCCKEYPERTFRAYEAREVCEESDVVDCKEQGMNPAIDKINKRLDGLLLHINEQAEEDQDWFDTNLEPHRLHANRQEKRLDSIHESFRLDNLKLAKRLDEVEASFESHEEHHSSTDKPDSPFKYFIKYDDSEYTGQEHWCPTLPVAFEMVHRLRDERNVKIYKIEDSEQYTLIYEGRAQ